MIQEISKNLGEIPRDLGIWKTFRLQICPPSGVKKFRPELQVIYDNQRKLLKEGKVVWAVLVQANIRLFEKGKKDHPANIVYSLDANTEDLPKLAEVANKVGYLKNRDFLLNEKEETLSDLVADEMKSAFDVELPMSFASGLKSFLTTIMIHRQHLPEKYLTNNYFPLLVHPETNASMIVPSEFWTERLLAAWKKSI